MKIFIDAGHNYSGCDTGAQGNGLREQDITFIIAKKLRDLLKNDGHAVKMSRNALTDNIGTTLNESLKKRVQMSNDWGADLFISIHTNAGGGKGTETYVYSTKSSAITYAQKIQNSIVQNLGMTNRGVKARPDLYVLANTKAPALLVETAFIDNIADAYDLANHPEKFAFAIYEAITGREATFTTELTEINDIVWELFSRGIVSDKDLWLDKLKTDQNSYWFARKCVHYIRGKED